MGIYTDPIEAKRMLDIDPDDHSEDVKINFCNEWAANLIDEYLCRPVFKKSRTEYPRPTNTQKLCLQARPVFTTPTIRCWVSPNNGGLYGQADDAFGDGTELTFGDDFGLQIDQDDGTSRSGILIRANALWAKPIIRRAGYLYPYTTEGFGSIKVQYTGGYTIDSLPSAFRLAGDALIARLLFLFPIGFEQNSAAYEDMAVSLITERKGWLLSVVKPMLYSYLNRSFA